MCYILSIVSKSALFTFSVKNKNNRMGRIATRQDRGQDERTFAAKDIFVILSSIRRVAILPIL